MIFFCKYFQPSSVGPIGNFGKSSRFIFVQVLLPFQNGMIDKAIRFLTGSNELNFAIAVGSCVRLM